MAASTKRKHSTEETVPKSSKRSKSDHKIGSKRDVSSSSAAKPTPTSSVSAKDQPAFPRGGAGLLTPLEKKQISAKASRDALAEQTKPRDLFGATHDASDISDDDGNDVSPENKEQRRAVKKRGKKRTAKEQHEQTASVHIEGLSYKRLAVGSLILGRISAINSEDLTISLPNNLTGFVPLTEISPKFSEKIENAIKPDTINTDDDDDERDSLADIDLASHFSVGQFVRVSVMSLGDEIDGHLQKKKIILSLDPKRANVGISRFSLTIGCAVQASVTNIEDHGLAVDLGIEDDTQTVRGFIATKTFEKFSPLSSARTGAVILCTVSGITSGGRIVKLSPGLADGLVLKNAQSVDAFLPGTLVEVLLSEVTSDGIAGKLMGLVDATADIVHSGSYSDRESFQEKYSVGQKVKGRLLCTFPLSEVKKVGFSILDDLVRASTVGQSGQNEDSSLKVSSIVPSAQVVRVSSGLGIYLSLPSENLGFAHISRLSDKKIESVSESIGQFKLGSKHKARILDFNSVDGLYLLSLQDKILAQKFLKLSDVTIGETVTGNIDKVLVGANGVEGLIVSIADGVSGLVPQIHMSDASLLHPEKKFRQGQTVTARVLSVNTTKRQMRLTLKKTLVNSDQKIWTNFDEIDLGETAVGTLVKVDPHGALIQFYGDVRGFLPVSEMSEAYIKDATDHFKVGQVLSVNALSVNPEHKRLTVSCRDRGTSIETALASVIPGTLVSGIVFEKSQSDLLLRLDGSEVIARLSVEHVAESSEKKRRSALERIRIGQRLEKVLVLDVQRTGRLVVLCNRASLVKAAQNGQFLKSWSELKEDMVVTGYVSSVTEVGVFVRFAAGISGLITKQQVPPETEEQPSFGFTLLQAVTARVAKIDYRGATPRFWLSMRQHSQENSKREKDDVQPEIPQLINPVDESMTSFTDFVVGKATKARITSIKHTQINVELAKDIHGRVDVSEIFDKWEEIKDRKHPLNSFYPKQILDVRILGVHNTRNHRFLPLTHRTGKNTVFELSAKPSTMQRSDVQALSLSDMEIGSSWLAYVNNIASDHLMVSINPSVRGRVQAIDVSDDLNLAADLKGNFPLGSAIRVRVASVDLEKNHLDLSGRSGTTDKSLRLQDLSPGMVLPGRVIRTSDRMVLVHISNDVVGTVDLTAMADDFALSNTALYQKNDVIRVCVTHVDIPNKKVALSTRPSKVLSSSMKVLDPEITEIKQLKEGDVVRGFIINVTDKGVFVSLGHSVTAFIRVTNLSDTFLKSWKDSFSRDQLVKGKVILVDQVAGHVQLSLKESVVSGTYKPPTTFSGLKPGDIVTGKVVKVETFGVFVLVDNSENVRGLCHRSEIAEQKVEDASKLFSQGDVVKVKVLKLDPPNRRINFGMKASYFAENVNEDPEDADVDEESNDSNSDRMQIEELIDERASTDSEDEGIRLVLDPSNNEISDDAADSVKDHEKSVGGITDAMIPLAGLSVGGFDWYGVSSNVDSNQASLIPNTNGSEEKPKKKKRKADIQVDHTGDLDAYGPRSTDDFERLLLGQPDSSMLWLQYMAFHLELGDIDAARQIGERALKTIGLGQEAEKLNAWIALLNLENAYGDEESIDSIFKRALEYNDAREMYSRLASIYIQSGKYEKANDLFQEMLKKFTQDPKIYINYAVFLFDNIDDADRGRAQLTRALQVLPSFTHFDITSKFAQLEFKSAAGLPERGRTIFEGLINSFPKRVDLFNVLLDLEMKQGDIDTIRALFARIFERKLKPKQAKFFFKRWLAFEESKGDEKHVEDVKAMAATWVKSQGG